jgi:hypothetical protein
MKPIARPRIDRLRVEPVGLPGFVGDLLELDIRYSGVGRMIPLDSGIYCGEEGPAEIFILDLKVEYLYLFCN